MATSGAGIDESVDNLQRFIGVLTVTIEAVREHAEAIDERADAIDELDGETEEAVSDLAAALADFDDDLSDGEHDALDRLESLGQEARNGSDDRLAGAKADVEQAGTGFEGVLEEGGARLEETHTELGRDGFDALASTVRDVESALAEDHRQLLVRFDQLDSAVAALETRAVAAHTHTAGELERAGALAAARLSSIETRASDGVAALDGSAGEVDAFCGDQENDLAGLYDGLTEDVDTQTAELVSGVEEALAASADIVSTSVEQELADRVQSLVEDAFGPYLGELAGLQLVLDDALAPAGELWPLVDELERALAVMDGISDLLRALE